MLTWLLERTIKEPIPLVLYTRAGCGLCEDMKRELRRARTREPFSLTEVDVDRDPELAERWGHRIPVLWIAGRRAFLGRTTAAEFERKFARLAAEYRRARELAAGLDAPGAAGRATDGPPAGEL